jgi:hypothetical protein
MTTTTGLNGAKLLDENRPKLRKPMNPQCVVPADNMDDETFIKHVNKRHSDTVSDLKFLWDTGNPDVTEAWRAFHDRLHRLRIDLTHYHRQQG